MARRALLFTKADETKMRKAGGRGTVAVCKVFGGSCTWIIFGSEVEGDDEILYGLACIDGLTQCASDMWGTVMRSELESVRTKPFNLPLERDRFFGRVGKGMTEFFEFYAKHNTLAGC